MKEKKYPVIMIVLHWLTVLLVAVAFFIGFTMEKYEFNAANFNYYRAHAFTGVAILLLTLVRLWFKRKNRNNVPQDIEYYSAGHKAFVLLIKRIMLLILLIAPVIGFIMVYKTGALQYDLGGPFPEGAKFNEVLEVIHKTLVFGFAALVFIHIAGVIVYKLKTGKNLIKKMCLLLK